MAGFISNTLHEVMAISDRVVVLRHGKLVDDVATRDADKHALAAMRIGAELTAPDLAPGVAGEQLFDLCALDSPAIGTAPGLKPVSIALRAGQVIGLAGRPSLRHRQRPGDQQSTADANPPLSGRRAKRSRRHASALGSA